MYKAATAVACRKTAVLHSVAFASGAEGRQAFRIFAISARDRGQDSEVTLVRTEEPGVRPLVRCCTQPGYWLYNISHCTIILYLVQGIRYCTYTEGHIGIAHHLCFCSLSQWSTNLTLYDTASAWITLRSRLGLLALALGRIHMSPSRYSWGRRTTLRKTSGSPDISRGRYEARPGPAGRTLRARLYTAYIAMIVYTCIASMALANCANGTTGRPSGRISTGALQRMASSMR